MPKLFDLQGMSAEDLKTIQDEAKRYSDFTSALRQDGALDKIVSVVVEDSAEITAKKQEITDHEGVLTAAEGDAKQAAEEKNEGSKSRAFGS